MPVLQVVGGCRMSPTQTKLTSIPTPMTSQTMRHTKPHPQPLATAETHSFPLNPIGNCESGLTNGFRLTRLGFRRRALLGHERILLSRLREGTGDEGLRPLVIFPRFHVQAWWHLGFSACHSHRSVFCVSARAGSKLPA